MATRDEQRKLQDRIIRRIERMWEYENVDSWTLTNSNNEPVITIADARKLLDERIDTNLANEQVCVSYDLWVYVPYA